MATNYGYEKGKYGIFAGTIIAFSRKLDGNDPNDPTWKSRVPAGYLRCNGEIKNGDDFPALRQILGVGEGSKFRKTGQILEELGEDGTGGQFQLPDLGSKYIKAFPASGGYEFDTIVNPVSENVVQKVGIEVDLTLNQGKVIEVNYQGLLSVPNNTVPISNNVNFGTNLASLSGNGAPDYTGYLPHGHYTNFVVRAYNDQTVNCSVSDASPELTQTNVDIVTGAITALAGSTESVTHIHNLPRSSISRSNTSNNITKAVEPQNLSTTINMNVDSTFKMDDIQPKFILVEYLIKI